MGKKIWFYIDWYCMIRTIQDRLLIFNTWNGSILESLLTPEIVKIIRRLRLARNMGVIPLSKLELQHPDVTRFIEEVREKVMGDMIDMELSDGKPLQLNTHVRIRERVVFAKGYNSFKVTGEKVMENLSQITIQLTNRCAHTCQVCKLAHKQILWCQSVPKKSTDLSVDKINSLCEELAGRDWLTINIIGGNIFTYPHWQEALVSFGTLPAKKNLVVHYLHAFDHLPELCSQLGERFSTAILADFPVDMDKMKKVAAAVQGVDPRATFRFLIASANDFTYAEQIIDTCALNHPEFHPFFNGHNLDMFQDNVFITQDDIMKAKPSRKKIFANQVLNALNFGKLIVMPDGKVKANEGGAILGEIGKQSLKELVLKELIQGKSWRKTRQRVSPCKECLYSHLCPPLSNYNQVMGKNDLCHINRPKEELTLVV